MQMFRSYREYSLEELEKVYVAFVAAGGNAVGLERFREIGLTLERLPLFCEEAARLHGEVGTDRIDLPFGDGVLFGPYAFLP